MTDALCAAALGRRYGRSWALRDCNLTIPVGCVTALVGANGAGKTTLLDMASGMLRPSEGSISVVGCDPIRSPGEALQRVAVVSQDHPLYPRFTVDDTMGFGRAMNHSWDDDLARRRIRDLGIDMRQRCGQLSGGQKAQVALTLALARRPQLLLLDEPVANLDPLSRRDFLRDLVEVAAEGISVILSSHIVAELDRTCNHLVVLTDGRLQLAGGIPGLLEGHRVLLVPNPELGAVTGIVAVLDRGPTENTSLVLTRVSQSTLSPGWDPRAPSLEDIVLGYLLSREDAPRRRAQPALQAVS